MEKYSKKETIYKPGGFLPTTESASTCNLDSPATRAVRNIGCLSHPVNGILLWQPKLKENQVNSDKSGK